MGRKKLGFILVILMLLLLINITGPTLQDTNVYTPSYEADYFYKPTLRAHMRRTDLIVRGKVISVQNFHGGMLYEFEVEEYFKGRGNNVINISGDFILGGEYILLLKSYYYENFGITINLAYHDVVFRIDQGSLYRIINYETHGLEKPFEEDKFNNPDRFMKWLRWNWLRF